MEKRRPFGCAEGKEALRGSRQTTAIGELSHSYLKSIVAHEAQTAKIHFARLGNSVRRLYVAWKVESEQAPVGSPDAGVVPSGQSARTYRGGWNAPTRDGKY